MINFVQIADKAHEHIIFSYPSRHKQNVDITHLPEYYQLYHNKNSDGHLFQILEIIKKFFTFTKSGNE